MSILCQKLVISENKPSAFAVAAAGARVPLFKMYYAKKLCGKNKRSQMTARGCFPLTQCSTLINNRSCQ